MSGRAAPPATSLRPCDGLVDMPRPPSSSCSAPDQQSPCPRRTRGRRRAASPSCGAAKALDRTRPRWTRGRRAAGWRCRARPRGGSRPRTAPADRPSRGRRQSGTNMAFLPPSSRETPTRRDGGARATSRPVRGAGEGDVVGVLDDLGAEAGPRRGTIWKTWHGQAGLVAAPRAQRCGQGGLGVRLSSRRRCRRAKAGIASPTAVSRGYSRGGSADHPARWRSSVTLVRVGIAPGVPLGLQVPGAYAAVVAGGEARPGTSSWACRRSLAGLQLDEVEDLGLSGQDQVVEGGTARAARCSHGESAPRTAWAARAPFEGLAGRLRGWTRGGPPASRR